MCFLTPYILVDENVCLMENVLLSEYDQACKILEIIYSLNITDNIH